MGLIETLLAGAVIALVLTGLVVASNSLRSGDADRQTRITLQRLQSALSIYHQRNHEYPAGPTEHTLAVLRSSEEISRLLRGLDIGPDSAGRIVCRDGYGRPVMYVAPQAGARHHPEFVSSGEDGNLGDPTSTAQQDRHNAMDNLYGSDTEGQTP